MKVQGIQIVYEYKQIRSATETKFLRLFIDNTLGPRAVCALLFPCFFTDEWIMHISVFFSHGSMPPNVAYFRGFFVLEEKVWLIGSCVEGV
jgi:hypothetical protein